jgi:hypothetical protein
MIYPHGSTLTSFIRLNAPAVIATADFGHLKCWATSAVSSSLAFPSRGGDFSFATQVPSVSCTSDEVRAFGFTLIRSVVFIINRNGQQ